MGMNDHILYYCTYNIEITQLYLKLLLSKEFMLNYSHFYSNDRNIILIKEHAKKGGA